MFSGSRPSTQVLTANKQTYSLFVSIRNAGVTWTSGNFVIFRSEELHVPRNSSGRCVPNPKKFFRMQKKLFLGKMNKIIASNHIKSPLWILRGKQKALIGQRPKAVKKSNQSPPFTTVALSVLASKGWCWSRGVSAGSCCSSGSWMFYRRTHMAMGQRKSYPKQPAAFTKRKNGPKPVVCRGFPFDPQPHT